MRQRRRGKVRGRGTEGEEFEMREEKDEDEEGRKTDRRKERRMEEEAAEERQGSTWAAASTALQVAPLHARRAPLSHLCVDTAAV